MAIKATVKKKVVAKSRSRTVKGDWGWPFGDKAARRGKKAYRKQQKEYKSYEKRKAKQEHAWYNAPEQKSMRDAYKRALKKK